LVLFPHLTSQLLKQLDLQWRTLVQAHFKATIVTLTIVTEVIAKVIVRHTVIMSVAIVWDPIRAGKAFLRMVCVATVNALKVGINGIVIALAEEVDVSN
jgi:hypothetical protein